MSKPEKPITIMRHAYGDIYASVEYRVPEAGKAELVFTSEKGVVARKQYMNFPVQENSGNA